MRFLIVNTKRRQLILIADAFEGVMTLPAALITPAVEIEETLVQPAIARLDDGFVFIYDTDRFLSEEKEMELEQLLAGYKS